MLEFRDLLEHGGTKPASRTPEESVSLPVTYDLNSQEGLWLLYEDNPFDFIKISTRYINVYRKRDSRDEALVLRGEVLEDFIDMQEFAEMFAVEFENGRDVFVPILVKSLAFSSSLSLLREKLASSDTFEGTTHDATLLNDIMTFWSMQQLCSGLQIDFDKYLVFYNERKQIDKDEEGRNVNEELFNMLKVLTMQGTEKRS